MQWQKYRTTGRSANVGVRTGVTVGTVTPARTSRGYHHPRQCGSPTAKLSMHLASVNLVCDPSPQSMEGPATRSVAIETTMKDPVNVNAVDAMMIERLVERLVGASVVAEAAPKRLVGARIVAEAVPKHPVGARLTETAIFAIVSAITLRHVATMKIPGTKMIEIEKCLDAPTARTTERSKATKVDCHEERAISLRLRSSRATSTRTRNVSPSTRDT